MTAGRGPAARRRRARDALAVAVTAVAGAAAAGVSLGAFGSEVGPPTPRISSGPAAATAARTAVFGIDAAPGLLLACALDRAGFVPCTSPVTYRRLVLGSHTFRVRARADVEGSWSGVASYTWRVVVRLPVTPTQRLPRPWLTTVPVAPYISPRAVFSWTVPPGRSWPARTTFACSLDRESWSPCTRPASYDGLASGPHHFRVRALLDGRKSRANQFYWTIALSVPGEPALLSALRTSATGTTITFAEDGAAGFECRLDGGDWQPCTSPVAYVGLQPGPHEFCVRALSAFGAAGPPRCFRWALPGPPPSPAPPAPDLFSVSGDLPGLLVPGRGGPLPLTVSNPNDFDLRVRDLVVSVRTGSTHPGCDGAANLQIVQSNGAAIVVPAHGSVTLPAQGATAPEVSMLDLLADQDACKGAVFQLDYTGWGDRA